MRNMFFLIQRVIRASIFFNFKGEKMSADGLPQAIREKNNAWIADLLAKGEDVNGVDRNGCPHLFMAVASGDLSIVLLLLRANAYVNITLASSVTPLHLAVLGNHTDIVGALLQYGAEAHLEDKWEKTARDWAKTLQYREVLEVMDLFAQTLSDEKLEGLDLMDNPWMVGGSDYEFFTQEELEFRGLTGDFQFG